MTEQLNQEIAEIENSTKDKGFGYTLEGNLEGANDVTMESQSFTLPSKTADWFDLDTIADIEKQSLPEFFRGVYPSKTPSTYKEYRDFMIKLYRMNPQTYITATSKCCFKTVNFVDLACRRHLSGDACAIVRVHAFLEKWGLINFNVQPELKPLRPSLLKESTYSKVLINATNAHHLTKNETEYLNNLFDVDQETQLLPTLGMP